MSNEWMLITVMLLAVVLIAGTIHIRLKGEGFVAGLCQGVFWVGSILLIPCLFRASELDSVTTPNMIGRLSNPFVITIVIIWVFCLWKVRKWLTIKPDKG